MTEEDGSQDEDVQTLLACLNGISQLICKFAREYEDPKKRETVKLTVRMMHGYIVSTFKLLDFLFQEDKLYVR